MHDGRNQKQSCQGELLITLSADSVLTEDKVSHKYHMSKMIICSSKYRMMLSSNSNSSRELYRGPSYLHYYETSKDDIIEDFSVGLRKVC